MRRYRELWLPEVEAQAATLVRAIEEADRDGDLLSRDERRRASEAARAASRRGPEVEKWLGRRSLALVKALENRIPSLPSLLRATRPGKGLMGPALILAFVAGVATNALGPSQRIQVLAIPLLGLIAWNVVSFVLLATRRWLLRWILPSRQPSRLVSLLESFARRSLPRYLPAEKTYRGQPEGHGLEERRLASQGLMAYLEGWFPATSPLAAARLRRLLHATALVLVAGAVAGMYLRGLAWEYRVSWESTFLSADQVESLLGWIFAPAVAVLGAEWPPQPLGELRSSPGSAAPWIHLYAVTAAIFVGVPRTLLVVGETLRCDRLRRRMKLKLPESYLRRLTAAVAAEAPRIDVLPYSHRPASKSFEALKKLLLEFFGSRSDVRLGKTLDYGAEIGELEGAVEGEASCCLILFPLSQTPELEVHGELLERWKERFADGSALLVLVDGSTYRRRLGVSAGGESSRLADRRLADRRSTWDRVFREVGLDAVHVDLGEALPDDTLVSLQAGAWPRGALGDVV